VTPMNIVVLDGFTLNPGDLNWDELCALGPCQVFDRTSPDETVARAASTGIVLTNKVVLNREVMAQLPALRYIGVLATGCNVVDIIAARERDIPVTNVPDYSTRSVAQLTFALLLELAHHIGHHSQSAREGRWSSSADFCYWDHPLVELAGLTFGIVGFGRIGRTVADIARAFGMRVLVHSRAWPERLPLEASFVDLETLFQQSDVVSLHCPLTPDTRHLVNATRLAQMKAGAWLINTGRGPLVDEEALATALNSGHLGGAGLDVLSTEPPPPTNPLLGARNCIITPHFAWATTAARRRLMRIAVDNVRSFLEGRPQNVVN
jgi:glycerate dehydrogenase